MDHSKFSSSSNSSTDQGHDAQRHFATTRWSMVARAGNPNDERTQKALADLCENYWHPLYAYARKRMSVEKAQDVTQSFFATLLEKNYVRSADRERGRFRAFLITAFKRFLINQYDRSNSIKRGGKSKLLTLDFDAADSTMKILAVDSLTPDDVFERQWALTLLDNVMEELERYYSAKGPDEHERFVRLKHLIGRPPTGEYSELAKEMGVSAETLRVQVHRMRQRYRETLRGEIAGTLATEDDIDDEIRRLFATLG